MQDFIWICGASCVGKKTLIEKLSRNEGELRLRFAIIGSFFACGPGLDRAEASIQASELADMKDDHIAIKWQWIHKGIPQQLRLLRPDARHRVILVYRPFAEHFAAVQQRNPEWGWDAERVTRERESAREFCRVLSGDGFPVEAVDGTDVAYRRIEDPGRP